MAAQDIDSRGPEKMVLFVCCKNTERSQMAEALLNAKYGDRFEAYSAGTEPSGVISPYAIKAMQEIGLDISKNRVKSVDEFIRARTAFDLVVTTCEEARKDCPYFAAPEQVHASFDDPQSTFGPEDERIERMRAVRDQIATWIVNNFGPPLRPVKGR